MRHAVRAERHALLLQQENSLRIEKSFLTLVAVPSVGPADLTGDKEDRCAHPPRSEYGPSVSIEAGVAVIECENDGLGWKGGRSSFAIRKPLREPDRLVSPRDERVHLQRELLRRNVVARKASSRWNLVDLVVHQDRELHRDSGPPFANRKAYLRNAANALSDAAMNPTA